jgi:hypothetical protein
MDGNLDFERGYRNSEGDVTSFLFFSAKKLKRAYLPPRFSSFSIARALDRFTSPPASIFMAVRFSRKKHSDESGSMVGSAWEIDSAARLVLFLQQLSLSSVAAGRRLILNSGLVSLSEWCPVFPSENTLPHREHTPVKV